LHHRQPIDQRPRVLHHLERRVELPAHGFDRDDRLDQQKQIGRQAASGDGVTSSPSPT
jgi:hypothetical protein